MLTKKAGFPDAKLGRSQCRLDTLGMLVYMRRSGIRRTVALLICPSVGISILLLPLALEKCMGGRVPTLAASSRDTVGDGSRPNYIQICAQYK